MKIAVVFELDDKTRRALRARCGRDGLATREEAATFIATAANATIGDVVFEYERELADAARRELE